MLGPQMDRGGIILVRLWTERPNGGLRARVTFRPGATAPAEEVCFASTVDELCRLFRQQVTAFVEDSRVR